MGLLLSRNGAIVTLAEISRTDVRFGDKTVLKAIDWRVGRGENWVVVGGNGAGKSTLLKLLRCEAWPDPETGGMVRYDLFGEGLTESAAGVRENIVAISGEKQESYARHEWNMDGLSAVLTGLTDSAWFQGTPSDEQLRAARTVLDALGLSALAAKRTLEMSQGELRKILLARALIAAPRLLILDEFCNGLDIPSRRDLLRLIENTARLGIQIIMTTHRPDEVILSVTHALLLKDGQIVAQGPKASVLTEANLKRTLESAFLKATGVPAPVPAKTDFANPSLFSLRDVHVILDGTPVLHSVDWEMRRDENWAVLGTNGAGKSTFLRLLLGDCFPALGGQIVRFGDDAPMSLWDIRKRIGHVSAALQTHYDPSVIGREVVLSGFFGSVGLYETPTKTQEDHARDIIERFGLTALAMRPLGAMSYGQARKFFLARALVHDPEVLILDEAFDGLDIPAREEALHLLETLAHTTPTRFVMVTHHLDELVPSVTHILLLKDGHVADSGPRAHILHPERFDAVFHAKTETGHHDTQERLKSILKQTSSSEVK